VTRGRRGRAPLAVGSVRFGAGAVSESRGAARDGEVEPQAEGFAGRSRLARAGHCGTEAARLAEIVVAEHQRERRAPARPVRVAKVQRAVDLTGVAEVGDPVGGPPGCVACLAADLEE
jgi:hypothetical protein